MKSRTSSSTIREFILSNLAKHPRDITKITSDAFSISRQAVNRHVRALVLEGLIEAKGRTRERQYTLKPLTKVSLTLLISKGLREDRVWRESVGPALAGLRRNVLDICHYGFTEMLNNVLDHSGGTAVAITIEHTWAQVRMTILDNGVGIFEKIKKELSLEDHRHAILELAKGKTTTDPQHHTGEGIFFTSRMFDLFSILSGEFYFQHRAPEDDWLIETQAALAVGTHVVMEISPRSERIAKEVFDRYASGVDYGFSRTHVPVVLAQYGEENLVSRSQAKRLLARFDKFKEVLLDFAGVNSIGRAFADEIFRVFRLQNPQIGLLWVRANDEVDKTIKSVLGEPRTGDAPRS